MTLVLLAQLLSPHDFGLVAIAGTIVTLAEAAFELPLSAVLTREPNLRSSHLDTSFTLSLGKGAVLVIASALFAIPASMIYHDSRLAGLIVVLMIGPVFRGLQSPALIFRMKELRFGAISMIEVSGKVVGLLFAVLVAYRFHSYWALVTTSVLTPVVMVATSYFVAPYRPRIGLTEWKTFSAFLRWTSVSQIVTAANWQCDRLLLGGFVPQAELGRYSLAGSLAVLPEQAIVKPLISPLLSAFAANIEPSKLCQLYLKSVRAIMMIGVPAMILLSALSYPLTTLLLGGGKWSAAAPILQWLALTPLLSLPAAPLPALAMVKGETRLFVERSLFEFAVQIPLVLLLTSLYGITGTLISRFVVGTYMLIVSCILVRRIGGITLLQQLFAIRESGFAGGVMALLLFAAAPFYSLQKDAFTLAFVTLVVGGAAIVTYIVIYSVCWVAFGRAAGLEQQFLRLLDIRIPRGPHPL